MAGVARGRRAYNDDKGDSGMTQQDEAVKTEVRRAGTQDIPVLLPLVEAYWECEGIGGFDTEGLAPQLEWLLADASVGAGWLALREGRAVGYLLGVYVFSLRHLGLAAEIDEFFVLPSCRDRGTGAALLEAAEWELKRAGCTHVSLQLARGNAAARRFCRRQGYGERTGYELFDKALFQG